MSAAPHLKVVLDDPDDAPVVESDREPLDVTSEAEMADWLRSNLGVGPLSGYFRREGEVVHCPSIGVDGYVEPTGDEATVRAATIEGLAARIQFQYWPYRMVSKKGQVTPTPTQAMFPKSAAQAVLAAPDMLTGIRDLRDIVNTPLVRSDGSVLGVPGYDNRSQLLYLPAPGFRMNPVPNEPTSADVKAAVALLDEMVAGFNFVTQHDKVNYYGLLLTPLLRELAPSPYKLFAIGAPQPGSGKTLLATLARTIHGGVFRSEMPEDDAELRKQITAILDGTTGPVVNFDNATGTVRSSVLAGLLTSSHWDDRKLGATEMVSRPNDRCWVITGNNLKLGGDLVRRTVWVTIDPGVPNPHLRTEFSIKDLEGWVRQHRGRLLHALLVLVRAWIVAGGQMTLNSSDGYSTWSATVSAILANAGVTGTFDHPDSARQEVGADDQEWADFLDAAFAEFEDDPWTAKELLQKVNDGTWGEAANDKYPISIDALPFELTHKLGRSDTGPLGLAKSLGMWLRNRDGRWAGTRTVRPAGKDRNKTVMWRIETAGGKS